MNNSNIEPLERLFDSNTARNKDKAIENFISRIISDYENAKERFGKQHLSKQEIQILIREEEERISRLEMHHQRCNPGHIQTDTHPLRYINSSIIEQLLDLREARSKVLSISYKWEMNKKHKKNRFKEDETWWEVTDGRKVFKCGGSNEAKWLRDSLNEAETPD